MSDRLKETISNLYSKLPSLNSIEKSVKKATLAMFASLVLYANAYSQNDPIGEIIEKNIEAEQTETQVVRNDKGMNEKIEAEHSYGRKIGVAYSGMENSQDFNHGLSIFGTMPVDGGTKLGLKFNDVFTKKLSSIEGKTKVPNNADLEFLVNVPHERANTSFSVEYNKNGDMIGSDTSVEPVDLDGDGNSDVEITNTTQTITKNDIMKFGLFTNINLNDFLLNLLASYGTNERETRQITNVYAPDPLNIDETIPIDYADSFKSYSLQLRPLALTDVVNFGLIVGLANDAYKFSFDNKIETTSKKQYSLGMSLDKEIGNGRFDLAGIANFNENYQTQEGIELFDKLHKNGFQAHLLGGYAFNKYPIAIVGHLSADGNFEKNGAKWAQTSPEFNGGLVLLITRNGKQKGTFNEYFNAKQASLYENHANDFLEVPKKTDFLLAYVPSDELFRVAFDIKRQGSKGKTNFGIAGNPLPYIQLFSNYSIENNNLNNKKYNSFGVGVSYLF